MQTHVASETAWFSIPNRYLPIFAMSLCVQSERRWARRAFYYACTTHCRRGAAACGEVMLAPMEALDRAILTTIEQGVLQPAIIAKAVKKALSDIKAQRNDGDPDEWRNALQKELAQVEGELARFVAAIGSGSASGSLSSVLAAIQEREERRPN